MTRNSASGAGPTGNGRQWTVYLSGEIHTDWRGELTSLAGEAGLPVTFTAPVVDHAASDDVGTAILGAEERERWRDRKGAQINAIRTRTLIADADIVVVRFALGDEPGGNYRQWNAAFDAGYAAALGTPIITLHSADGRSRTQGGRRRHAGSSRHRATGSGDPPLRHRLGR